MKRNILPTLLLSAALFTITSCSESDNDEETSAKTACITFSAETPGSEANTRTALGHDENNRAIALWSENDRLTVFGSGNGCSEGGYQTGSAQFTTPNGSRAVFNLVGDGAQKISDSDEFNILYYIPNGSFKPSATYDNAAKTIRGIHVGWGYNNQTIPVNTLDFYDDVLVSKNYKKGEVDLNSQVNIKVKRLTSFIRFKISDATDTDNNGSGNKKYAGMYVTHIDLGCKELEPFTINFDYKVDTDEVIPTQKYGTIGQDYTEGERPQIDNKDHYAYMGCMPATIPSGKMMVVRIHVEGGHTITKNILLDKPIVLEAGKIKTIKLNLKSTDLME